MTMVETSMGATITGTMTTMGETMMAGTAMTMGMKTTKETTTVTTTERKEHVKNWGAMFLIAVQEKIETCKQTLKAMATNVGVKEICIVRTVSTVRTPQLLSLQFPSNVVSLYLVTSHCLCDLFCVVWWATLLTSTDSLEC